MNGSSKDKFQGFRFDICTIYLDGVNCRCSTLPSGFIALSGTLDTDGEAMEV